jgi:hypothetical protein
MGWTFTHRERGISNLEWFRREFCPDEPERLIDLATKNGVAYGAYRWNGPGGDEIVGLVILTRWDRNSYHNYGWKDMDETQGPFETNCPARILDLLTPTDDKYAVEWRAKCRANLAKAEAAKAVKPGTVIRLPQALTFSGGWGDFDTFEFVKRNRFIAIDADGRKVVTVSLGADWKQRDFEIVQEVAA